MAGAKSKGWGGGKARKGKDKPLPNPLFQNSVSPTSYPSLLLLTPRRRLGWWNAGGNRVNRSLGLTPPQSSFIISELTQQDDRKKRMAKRLSVTNVTGLLLACFVGNSLNIDVFCSSTKRSV